MVRSSAGKSIPMGEPMIPLALKDLSGEAREWDLPFTNAEYRDRANKVRNEMRKCGVDTLFVSSPANLTYLTGYDSRWYRRSTPTGLAINTDDERLIFFDDVSHQGLLEAGTGIIRHGALFSRFRDVTQHDWIYRNTCDDIVATLKGLGWLKGVAAVEHWALAPGGVALRHIELRMAEAGAAIKDGSWIVDDVKLIKSARELEYIEEACRIADAAIEAVKSEFRPGMTEIQVQGIAHYAMSKMNGEEPAIRTSCTSGPKTRAHHPVPTRRKIVHGDIFLMDICGSVHRYHGNLARTFSVGEPDPRWMSLSERSAGCMKVVMDAVKPGDPCERIVEVAQAYLASVGLGDKGWFVGGYDLGVAIPPDWVGHTYLNGRCFRRADMNPGMVTNFENVLDVLEGWPGGYGYQFVDTLIMTDRGLEVPSTLPREITVLAG